MRIPLKLFLLISISISIVVAACNESGSTEKPKQEPTLSGDLVKNPNSLSGSEQKLPELTFEVTKHDFGKLTEGEEASFDFRFTNTGQAPLIISEVKASCGCTTPQWPKGMIKPGESGVIKVAYDSKGRPGEFSKGVVVAANTYPNQTVLTVSGVVFKK